MLIINKDQIYSSEDKYIHLLGTELYFKRGGVTPSQTLEDFEEVDELPKYTRQEYVDKVRKLIKEEYQVEDEIALYRQKEAKPEEFEKYNKFCEDCKIKAKEILLNREEDPYIN